MLEILYQDDHYVAVHKPSGLFVHPTKLAPREASCMPKLRRQLGQSVFTVHRLDRATSGVLLFALSPEAAREACLLFEERTVKKQYLAVVRGFTPESGRIEHPLRESRNKKPAQAITDYTRERTVDLPEPVGKHPTARYSLVRALPLTGRMHQIRKHFAHISHPIVGDTNYGDGSQNRFFRSNFNIRRLLLLATDLTFDHPYTGKLLTIEAPIPEDIRDLFVKFDWEHSGLTPPAA